MKPKILSLSLVANFILSIFVFSSIFHGSQIRSIEDYAHVQIVDGANINGLPSNISMHLSHGNTHFEYLKSVFNVRVESQHDVDLYSYSNFTVIAYIVVDKKSGIIKSVFWENT